LIFFVSQIDEKEVSQIKTNLRQEEEQAYLAGDRHRSISSRRSPTLFQQFLKILDTIFVLVVVSIFFLLNVTLFPYKEFRGFI
jgi:hypothetical protein